MALVIPIDGNSVETRGWSYFFEDIISITDTTLKGKGTHLDSDLRTPIRVEMTGSFIHDGGELDGGTVKGVEIKRGAGYFNFEVKGLSVEAAPLVEAFLAKNDNAVGRLLFQGDDVMRGSKTKFDSIQGWGGDDRIFTFGGNDDVFGGAGNDLIKGGSGRDLLHGGNGKDRIFGGTGGDFLNGDAGNDRVFGGDGNDRIWGDSNDTALTRGNDTLFGGRGRDDLFGGAGRDRLFGGKGNDNLEGGYGSDIMTGGAGRDSFEAFEGKGVDKITDFQPGLDRITIFDEYYEFDFSDITLKQKGQNVEVTFLGGDPELILLNVDTDALSAGDFLFY